MEDKKKIRSFIHKNMNILDQNIQVKDHDHIFELGFVDSMFAMKLVLFLEKEFSIELNNDDLTPQNFSSVDSMSSLLHSKQAAV